MRAFEATTQPFRAGALAGAGSFRCESCGFTVSLHEQDQLPPCPHCGGAVFRRASMFGESAASEPWGGGPSEDPVWLEEARDALANAGDYLAFHDDERLRVIPLQDGWTRLGRSLAAHVRFDDPTVSRRHAMIHREDGEIRVLDDRSLNGLFVNGERVDWHGLQDGDELLIGRFRIYFIRLAADAAGERGRRFGSTVG